MEITYKISREFQPISVKLNNQQQQIVKLLLDSGKTEFSKAEVESVLTGKLTTRQSSWLVFKFYQPHFVHVGFLSLDRKLNPPIIRKSVKKEETKI